MKRAVAPLVLGAIAVLVVSACGGADPTATAAPRPTATPSSVAPPTATPPPRATGQPTGAPAASPTATARPAATPTAAPTATAKPADAPKYGGVLKQATYGGTASLQTALNNASLGVSNNFASRLIYQPLLWFNPYNKHTLEGYLAEGWEFAPAADKLTLRLRPEARWSDGKPLTAADVKFTLDKYLTPPERYAATGAANNIRQTVASVTVVDGVTVRLDLKTPDVSLPALLADNDAAMLPAHRTLEQSAKEPMGSGAYRLTETQADVKYVFVKNPNYWAIDRGNKLPYLDGIENIEFVDATRAFAAVLTGQMDLLNTNWLSALQGKEAEVKSRLPRAALHAYPGGNIGWGFKNTRPYDNPSVRKAFSLLTDRLGFIELVQNGNGLIDGLGVRPASSGNQWGLPMEEVMKTPGYRYINKKTGELETDALKLKAGLSAMYEKDPKDIALGKQMLQEAGLLDPAKGVYPGFVTLIWGTPIYEGTSSVLHETLRKMLGGGKYSVETTDSAAFTTRRTQGQFETIVFALHASAADEPSLTLRALTTGNGLWNHGFQVPELDALFAQQKAQTDPAKRRDLVWQVQRKLLEIAHLVPGSNSLNSTGLVREWVVNAPTPVGGSSNVFGLDRVALDRPR